YHTISLAQWVAHVQKGAALPTKPIVITFDDGYQDNLENALPVLEHHHFTATFFIIAGKVGRTVRWTAENGRPIARLMDWHGVVRLDRDGMEIGSHTLSHPDLSKLSYTQQLPEMKGSRLEIARHVGHRVWMFSYPFGRYNTGSLRALKAAGFEAAVTTKQGFNDAKTNLLELRRIRVRGGESLWAFASSLQLGYSGPHP
ncbi:MAG TPA: polysaccharide deacetylase family protein, partial [Limnochordia bacterium]|nr:polysaccharide deacetylase family protein [Limnochordia bacterium]